MSCKEAAARLDMSEGTIRNLERKGLLPRVEDEEDVKRGLRRPRVYYHHDSILKIMQTYRPTRASKSVMMQERIAADRGKAAAAVFKACAAGLTYQEIVIASELDPAMVKSLMREFKNGPETIEANLKAEQEERESKDDWQKRRNARRREESNVQRHKQALEIENIRKEAMIEAAKIAAGKQEAEQPRIRSLLDSRLNSARKE